jgi:hypothetical protein
MSKKYKYVFNTLGASEGDEERPVINTITRYSRRDALSYLKGMGIKTSDLPKEREEYIIGQAKTLEFLKERW